jgi:hypothetical protein
MKQETLEEAKQRYAEFTYCYPLERVKTFDKEAQMELLRRQFELGAKWQQEQDNKEIAMWKLAVEKQEARCIALKSLVTDALLKSYDKKEVLEQLNLLYSMKNSMVDTFTDDDDYITMKWFEQFKEDKP